MTKKPGTLVNSGIYLISCRTNNKKYVGHSRHVWKRCNEHFQELERGQHLNMHLQQDYDNFGKKAFDCIPLELNVPYENLYSRETYYILALDTIENGYNQIVSCVETAELIRAARLRTEKERRHLVCWLAANMNLDSHKIESDFVNQRIEWRNLVQVIEYVCDNSYHIKQKITDCVRNDAPF